MKTVGVIGAGQMGAGIAQVSAQAGYTTLLSDISLERAEAGKAGIAKLLARAVEKGKLEQGDAEGAGVHIQQQRARRALHPGRHLRQRRRVDRPAALPQPQQGRHRAQARIGILQAHSIINVGGLGNVGKDAANGIGSTWQ